jgi:hypothetical protein
VPLPVPLAPELIDSHEVAVVAVHAHVGADAVMAICAVPALDPGDWLVADNVNVHGGAAGGGAAGGGAAGGAAACVTVTVCPATVTVPVLGAGVVFAAIVYVVVPLPTPLAPELIVSHDVVVDANHAQVGDDAVTVI